MELAEEEDAFDVFGYLKKLRQSRRGLIENLVNSRYRSSFYFCSKKDLNLSFPCKVLLILKILSNILNIIKNLKILVLI